MAYPKLFLLGCFLLIVQTQAYPQTVEKIPDIDVIKQAVQRVEKAINYVIENADDIVKNPEESQKRLVERATKAFDDVLNIVNSFLDSILEGYKADERTVKIINCVKGSKDASRKVYVDFITETTKCGSPYSTKIFEEIKNLGPEVLQFKTDLFKALDEIQKCDELDCIPSVFKDVLRVVDQTKPEVISKVIDLLLDSSEVIRKEYPVCVSPNAQTLVKEGSAVVESVISCIAAV